MSSATIHHGDCLEVLRTMPDNSVDAVVCDPPYGLSNTTPDKVTDTIVRWAQGDREYVPQGRGFMGASWDAFVPPVAVWDECLRVLKPGGHLVAFAGSRTQDLMGLAIRLAGFDVRENLAWIAGSGFPKSHDISKAIDKMAGADREAVGTKVYAGGHVQNSNGTDLGRMNDDGWTPTNGRTVTAPATPAAEKWQGWGTALKPAHEPIILARKPLSEKTVAANHLAWGTGGINVDATRIGPKADPPFMYAAKAPKRERPTYTTEDGQIVQHSTVKPLSIMSWLTKLVCPEGGTILDPFAGSGTTIEAALLNGFNVIGIEREDAYLPLIQQRIDRANEQLPLAS